MEYIKYGLKLKNSEELLKCKENYNFDMVSYELTTNGKCDWLVDSMNKVLCVMYNSTNVNSYDSPLNFYNEKDLEIVKVKIAVKEEKVQTIKVKLSTMAEKMDLIPNYINSTLIDTFDMIGEIAIAIDKGNYYQIIKMNGLDTSILEESKFDKKYFKII